MAVTYTDNGGNRDGSNLEFTYSFPTIEETNTTSNTNSEVKVALNGVTQAANRYTVETSPSARIKFNNTNGVDSTVQESTGAPKSGVTVRVYRDTAVDSASVVFAAGSAIRAADLNVIVDQSLYHNQEQQNQKILAENIEDGAVTSDKIKDDTIVNADINTAAEIAVTKLGHSTTNKEVIQTNGSDVEWTSSIDLPGSLGVGTTATVDGATTLKDDVTVQADNKKLTVKNASGTVQFYVDTDNGKIYSGTDALDPIAGEQAVFGGKVVSIGAGTRQSDGTADGGFETALGDLRMLWDTGKIVAGTTAGAEKATITGATGIIETAGTITADGNVTFKGDVTLDNGTNDGKDLTWDASDNALEFKDNVKAHFGDSNDLQIYHDGSNSYVKDAGEGSLRIQGDGFSISDGGSNTWIGGTGAATQLWAGSGIKLATSSTGVEITGETKTTTLEIGGVDVDATAAEINDICENHTFKTSSGTLDSTSDTEIPSSKVINTRIVAVADQIGGFVPVADKDNFPTSNPDPSGGAGTVVSISDAAGIEVDINGQGTGATRAGGSDAVIINGFPSAMRGNATHGPTDRQVTNANPYEIPSGVGLLVQTTSTPHTYNYHKVQPTESDIVTLNDTVEDFQARYRLGSSNPGSANNEGDLFFNTTTNKMLVYNGSAWADISATGNYFSTTTAVAGAEGDTIPGGQAAFDGTAKKFKLSLTGDQIPSNAFQITVSLNGVIQKPNSGTTVPSEGFAWDSTNNWIIFADAIPASTPYFIVVSGSQVNVTTVQDNEVDLAQLAHKTAGQILYYGASGVPSVLDADAGKFLKSGTNGPTWETVAQTDTTYTHTWQDSSDDAILRLTAGGSGSGNDDLKIVAGSNITLTPSGDDLTIAATDTNTQLTTEQVQDIVGGMVTGNTETGITVTYDDTDGTLDFVASGTTTFLGLTDTPSSFTAGKHLKVNSGGNALELTDAPSGTITALNNQTADRLTTIGATTTELDGEASLTFNDAATTGLISGRQITGRGFECPAEVSDDWTIAAGNNECFLDQ